MLMNYKELKIFFKCQFNLSRGHLRILFCQHFISLLRLIKCWQKFQMGFSFNGLKEQVYFFKYLGKKGIKQLSDC